MLATWVTLMCGVLVPVTFGLLGAMKRKHILAIAAALCAILGTLTSAGSWLSRRNEWWLTFVGFIFFASSVALIARLGPALFDE